MKRTRTPKRASEDVRREQILGAAFKVACQQGLGGLTVRAVAAEAGLSHALVLFHFGRKQRLMLELLDWLIAGMMVLHITEDVAHFPHARDRIHALIEQEMGRMSHQPEHTRLFLEFWALGALEAGVRVRISSELERYRAAFRSLMEELMAAEPTQFVGSTADGLAAVAVSWIHGCAVQAVIDPDHFNWDEYLAAVRGMIDPQVP